MELSDQEIERLLLRDSGSIASEGNPGILDCESKEEGFYPKVDLSIWLRSCIKEQNMPMKGIVRGEIPQWLQGSLLQNGPGKFNYGSQVARHLFDGAGLLQKFMICDGAVFYQCRYLRSNNFKKNIKAGKFVSSEFATSSLRDKPVLDRIKCLSDLSNVLSDNTFISVNPLGKDYFCFYESPFVLQIDPRNLHTITTIDLNKALGLITNTAHVHYDEHGNMISVGLKVGMTGPQYVIKKTSVDLNKNVGLSHEGQSGLERFSACTEMANVRSRSALSPSYMHSFSLTDHFFILIEQPLTMNVPSLARGVVMGKPLIDSMRWNGGQSCIFHIIDRITGQKLWTTYKSEAFFYLHTINAYEDSDHIVIDIACYDSPDMLYCMLIDHLSTAQSDPDYARKFRGYPRRYVLPLKPAASSGSSGNLVTLSGTRAQASYRKGKKHVIQLKPEKICHVGCETPTINYDRCNGKKYRYFYAITSDVDDPLSAGQIYKVDTITHDVFSWSEDNTYCAEPIFIPNPDSLEEDDGVLVSSMIKGKPDVDYTALLVLDAKTMTEIARAEFRCSGPVPKPLHGYFTGNNVSKLRSSKIKIT